ncbi:DUF3658 domain-containing protein [Bacillus carboniphilus]|uniref:DUF3658 domain-containing protein n=1 Tax=Bacillus carboniphilus TaxID=86663 RepID=A0ABP3G9Q5_9BACI
MFRDREWLSYELTDREEFESFRHEKYKAVEGKGFCFDQNELNKMVEEINKLIQKYRHLKGQGPVHIVNTESAAGSIRVGLERPKTVIGFPDSFSIGPLWRLDEKIGKTYRSEWLYENINSEQEDFVYENKFTNTLREIEDIEEDVPIYIWYGNNAGEQVGLHYFLYLLRDKNNPIYLLDTSKLYKNYDARGEEQRILHTSQIDPQNANLFFELKKETKPLSMTQLAQFHDEWKMLSQTKEVLRLWRNGEMIGVPEDYYDPLIIETIEKMHSEQETKDFIKAVIVIGEMLTHMDEIMDIYFLEFRIGHLIYSGVLELKGVPRSMRHYSVKLR